MTPTPRERAERVLNEWNRTNHPGETLVGFIARAIEDAVAEERVVCEMICEALGSGFHYESNAAASTALRRAADAIRARGGGR